MNEPNEMKKRLKALLSWKVLLPGVVIIILGALGVWYLQTRPPAVVEEKPSLALEKAYVRVRDVEVDAGTVHVFVRNISDSELSIKDVFLDGFSVMNLKDAECEGFPVKRLSNPLVVWATVFPPKLAPGRVADIMLRLRNRLKRERTVRIVPETGIPVEVKVDPATPRDTLQIDDIAFSENLARTYVYVRNTGSQAVSHPDFTFDLPGESPQVIYCWDQLKPGEKKVAIFAWPQPLVRGSTLNLALGTRQGQTVQASVRVFSLFPISAWPHGGYQGDTRRSLRFDPAMFCVPYPVAGGDPKEKAPGPATAETPNQGVYVYRNTTCRDGNFKQPLGTNANICWHRAWETFNQDRERACFLHVCMYQKIRSCYVYGEVLDFVGFTPFEVTGYPHTGNRRYSGNPLRNAIYARTAKAGGAPRPAILNQQCGLLPQELLISVLAQIGEGVSGVLYSGSQGYQPGTAEARALRRVNSMLQRLKPYLRIGDPCPMEVSVPEGVRAYTILGGDRGIVLIVINERFANQFLESKGWIEHKGEAWPAVKGEAIASKADVLACIDTAATAKTVPGKDRGFHAHPRSWVKVELTAPVCVVVQKCIDVTAGGSVELELKTKVLEDERKRITLNIPYLSTVKVYLLGDNEIKLAE